MRLRDATPGDLALLAEWQRQPHLASTGVDAWDWETQLGRRAPWREMLIAEEQGQPIGFLQTVDPAEEESRYWGDCPPGVRAIDIWIGRAGATGRGFGRAMMALAVERCFADPAVSAILVDPLASNTRAHHFYRAVGFQPVGRRAFGADDCLVFRLERRDRRRGS